MSNNENEKIINFWSTSSDDWKLRRFNQNMFNIFTDIICHPTKFGWLSLYRFSWRQGLLCRERKRTNGSAQ